MHIQVLNRLTNYCLHPGKDSADYKDLEITYVLPASRNEARRSEVSTTAASLFQRQTLTGLPIHSAPLGHPHEGTWECLLPLHGTHRCRRLSSHFPPRVLLYTSHTLWNIALSKWRRTSLDPGKQSTSSRVFSFPDTFSRCFLLISMLRGGKGSDFILSIFPPPKLH